VTGPDHYRIAEDLLVDARRAQDEDDASRMRRLVIAQIHATLAQAAATAGGEQGWDDVLTP
jgi:hypothetical protein